MEEQQNEPVAPARPTPPPLRTMPAPEPLISDNVKTVLLFLLIIGVAYLLYDNYQFQGKIRTELTKLGGDVQALENKNKAGDAKISTLKDELQDAVGSAKAQIKKTAAQIQSEGQRTKQELTQALSSKADTTQVQSQVNAAKQEADAKIGQVSSEVGGVKTEVGTVKTDLASTKRDLDGTQRQLVDVRESLTAAVAKNSSELSELRRKGEKDYFEFEIPKRNQITKVEDIRVILTRTDPKKGRYNVQILVDDNKLDKKDRAINEPIQFLVGRNRVRYELVVNWVQKEKAGGYLSIPKDKSLSAERPTAK